MTDKKTKILLVEDEAVTAMDINANLLQIGYEVLDIVSSGEEAITQAEALCPDLILMDISLDGAMTGIQAASEIRQRHAIPIIFLTAHAEMVTIAQAKKTNPAGYLSKPCSVGTLMSTIEMALYKAEVEAMQQGVETALRESEKRYRMLFTSMRNGFSLHEVICDEAGRPCNYRFIEVNPAFEAMIGLKARDIIGKTVLEVMPMIGPSWIEAFGKVAQTGESARLSNFAVDQQRHYQVDAYCPEPGRFAAIIVDITEKVRLEEQLRQAQKMESIGQFAGGIAHDFNNILSVILGCGALALSAMAKDDPQRQNITNIIEAADRAAHLTKDLLLFSRKHVSARRPMDLNESIKRVEKFLKRVIGEDIDCQTTLSPGVLSIVGDPPQLQQVLMNLATNARDAMPNGGTLTITTGPVRFDAETISIHGYCKPGHYAMISVADTGNGMDESTLQHIFEPFFTTKEMEKGTGLGLAVVFGIIKQHDGFINVDSEPGRGTTFRVYLPLNVQGVSEEIAPLTERPSTGCETILLAEDDDTVRLTIKTLLEYSGYTVLTASDGQEAVDTFKANRDTIKLLILDIIMPNKNGKEAYDEIRQLRPGIKAIFQSGYTPDFIQRKVVSEVAMPVNYKPMPPAELLRQVRDMLDQ